MINKKTESEQKRILITDDNEEILEILDKVLSGEKYQVLKASRGEEALIKVKEEKPDLIILDITMPGMDGIEVKAKLNEDTSTASIPVIFLTSRATTSDKVAGFNLGIDDYITKPFEFEELLARIKSALNRRKFYEEISMSDGLTGLYNVHYFKKEFDLFFNIAKRYKKVFSLAIVDVDNFKEINDNYGHAVGDFTLKKVSSIMKKTLRKSDILMRYGGDEFIIILPESDEDQAVRAMERVREKIKDKVFVFKDTGAKITFSISIGVAGYRDSLKNETQMLELADNRMYEDKKMAKNKKNRPRKEDQ